MLTRHLAQAPPTSLVNATPPSPINHSLEWETGVLSGKAHQILWLWQQVMPEFHVPGENSRGVKAVTKRRGKPFFPPVSSFLASAHALRYFLHSQKCAPSPSGSHRAKDFSQDSALGSPLLESPVFENSNRKETDSRLMC